MKAPLIKNLIERLEQIKKELPAAFSTLSEEQFNWQPGPERWSVGQCVDHIIVSNEVYFPALESVINGTAKGNFWSKIPGWTSLCGWLMLSSIQPEPKRKVKTVAVFEPSQSAIPKSRLKDFEENCTKLINYFKQLEGLDLKKTVLISPATGLITFKLQDNITLLTNHAERHFFQAREVMQTKGYPA